MHLANWAELLWNQNQRLIGENAKLWEQGEEARQVIDTIVQASFQVPPVYVPQPSTLEEVQNG
jgi:hypothetical protein